MQPYEDATRLAVYQVMSERRDVRQGFLTDPVPDDVLLRVLEAAHTAPSVGFSQPWDFLVLRDREVRARVRDIVQRARESYADSIPGARRRAFGGLKIESILDTPLNLVVTSDPTRGGRHTLGRHTQPRMSGYSTALAVQNLWLAARAEGLGVGWVSFGTSARSPGPSGCPTISSSSPTSASVTSRRSPLSRSWPPPAGPDAGHCRGRSITTASEHAVFPDRRSCPCWTARWRPCGRSTPPRFAVPRSTRPV